MEAVQGRPEEKIGVVDVESRLADKKRLANAEAIWDMAVREVAEQKLREAGLEPADVLQLLKAHELDLLYEVETLANEPFRDFTIQAWRAAGKTFWDRISRGRPHRDAYLDAVKSFFIEYATSVMRLHEEWEASSDKAREFWKLEIRGQADLGLGDISRTGG